MIFYGTNDMLLSTEKLQGKKLKEGRRDNLHIKRELKDISTRGNV